MLEGSEHNSDVAVSKVAHHQLTEMEQFFNNLSLCDTKPTVLSLVSPDSDTYVPEVSLALQPMTSLCNPANCKLSIWLVSG